MDKFLEYLDKAIRVEDQILIGEQRTSRTAAMIGRMVEALKAEATGDTERAVLDKSGIFVAKFIEIVGAR